MLAVASPDEVPPNGHIQRLRDRQTKRLGLFGHLAGPVQLCYIRTNFVELIGAAFHANRHLPYAWN